MAKKRIIYVTEVHMLCANYCNFDLWAVMICVLVDNGFTVRSHFRDRLEGQKLYEIERKPRKFDWAWREIINE